MTIHTKQHKVKCIFTYTAVLLAATSITFHIHTVAWSIYNDLLSDCFHAYISLQKHHSCFNHIWSSQLQFV